VHEAVEEEFQAEKEEEAYESELIQSRSKKEIIKAKKGI
jgi:hypothetical protein